MINNALLMHVIETRATLGIWGNAETSSAVRTRSKRQQYCGCGWYIRLQVSVECVSLSSPEIVEGETTDMYPLTRKDQ